MKLKKIMKVFAFAALTLSISAPTFAASKEVWVHNKYPKAWRIEFFKDKGVGKVRVYPRRGSLDYFIVTCDTIDNDRCYVQN